MNLGKLSLTRLVPYIIDSVISPSAVHLGLPSHLWVHPVYQIPDKNLFSLAPWALQSHPPPPRKVTVQRTSHGSHALLFSTLNLLGFCGDILVPPGGIGVGSSMWFYQMVRELFTFSPTGRWNPRLTLILGNQEVKGSCTIKQTPDGYSLRV